MRFTLRRVFAILVLAAPVLGAAQHGVGMLVRARAAEVQSRLTSVFTPAKLHEQVFAGDGIRTLRRGFADIQFTDNSEIRLNERSDLVLEDSYTMRRYALSEGAIWVRVVKGERTVVRTPVGTATARGTVFTIDAHGTLSVLEGTVQFDAGGATTLVHAGQTVTFSPQANAFTPNQNAYNIVQPSSGYTSDGWFDHPGPDGFTAANLTPTDSLSRQFALYGDSTPAGGLVSAADILAGIGALGAADAAFGQGGGARNLPPAPEPGVAVGLLTGMGVLGFVRRRKRLGNP